MAQEKRTVAYNNLLKIEAYHFEGIMQKFPNHFHDYYVFGFIEEGKRYLKCKNQEYITSTGDLIIFNPKDNHCCEQVDNRPLDYRSLNIQADIMKRITYDLNGINDAPFFSATVIQDSNLVVTLRDLHQMIMEDANDFKKEEALLFLMSQLIEKYTENQLSITYSRKPDTIKEICQFLNINYMNNIRLDDLCELSGLSKYYLLHSFTKEMGISPYNYLKAIRIEQAKKLLEKQISITEVAHLTGFSDQSHFSKFFKQCIGLTPKQYAKIFIQK